ncbi:MAG: adenylosuccinate synthetase [Nitrososphaeraceae archaeon]
MTCTVVVGGFYGDEGKGKLIAYLAQKDKISIAVRGGVGPNAGHTFALDGIKYKVRMLPSAVLNPSTRLLIGPGVLIDPTVLQSEIKAFNSQDRTFVDRNCAIIEKKHIEKDSSLNHLVEKVGTTGTGTGPANADRALRTARIAKEIPELAIYLEDVSDAVIRALENNENILAEGTQGTYLSLYHGDYPYVTSKDVTASAVCSDVGIGPKSVDEVLIVFKSYVTRVGKGPLNDEFTSEQTESRGWQEYGSVTGRLRRAAPFDINLAKKAIKLNSASQLAVTKLDIVFPECAGMKDFAKLPEKAKQFIENIEIESRKPVTIIGTGEDLTEVIDRRPQK